MVKMRAQFLLLAAAALTACSSAGNERRKAALAKNPAPCPNVIVLEDAARLVDFSGEERIEDVAYSAEIVDIRLDCRYFADKPIKASVRIDFAFGRGPKGESAKHDFSYFVAVTRRNSEVIEKAEFVIPVNFGAPGSVRTARETIDEIVIPRASEKTSGTNFEVVVGLSLSAKQAIYNRSGKSLKFPSIQ